MSAVTQFGDNQLRLLKDMARNSERCRQPMFFYAISEAEAHQQPAPNARRERSELCAR